MRSIKVQPSYVNEESIEQDQKQNHQFKRRLLTAGQTSNTTIKDKPFQLMGPPHRLTLPFSLYPKRESKVSGRQANSNGLLRHTRLISDSSVERCKPLSASILSEDIGNADTSPFATRDLISALDTATMVAVRPRAIELRQQDMLASTLIEDITQRVTLTLPAVARDAEQEDQINQRQDITATASGAGIAGLGTLMSSALRYVTNIAMTHMVSPAIYGAFGEVYTAVTLLGWIANSGFSGILTYLLPGYRVKGERDLAGGLASFATWSTLIYGFLIGVLFFASAALIARVFYHDPSYRLPLQEVALLIPLLALQQLFCSGLQAFKEVKWKVSIEQLGQPLITLIALVIFYLLGWRMEALSFSAIGGFLCSMLIAQSIFRKSVKRFTGDTPPKYTLRPWIGFAAPLLFTGLIFNIVNTTDILFLSIFVTPAQAGIYIAANRVSNFVSMPLGPLNIISLPLMTEYYAKGKHVQLESMCKLITKWSLSLSLPVCLCCLIFHDAILGIFGPQYTAGWLVLALLCLGNLVNAGTGSVPLLLSITKRLRVIWIDSILAIILNVGLCFILVPRFNILGAALAAALTDAIIQGFCTIQVYLIMKLHPYRWDMCKPFLAGGAASLVGILLLHFVHFQPGLGRFAIFEQLGLITPFILVYVLLMLLLRFSEEDRIVFHAVLTRFGRQRSTNMVRTS